MRCFCWCLNSYFYTHQRNFVILQIAEAKAKEEEAALKKVKEAEAKVS